MKIEIFADENEVARAAAGIIAAEARKAVAKRGRFLMAVSGGRTPWAMLRDLASEEVPWNDVHLFQIDERIAPEGDPDRNLSHLHDSLFVNSPGALIPRENIHAMNVTAGDPFAGAAEYEKTLQKLCGNPAVLDLAHLGLGPDGHTASLIPGDPVLQVRDRDVSITGEYQRRRRMTLTYPMINRSRMILWLATGSEKAPMIVRLKAADPLIPAGLVEQGNALLLADKSAASIVTGL